MDLLEHNTVCLSNLTLFYCMSIFLEFALKDGDIFSPRSVVFQRIDPQCLIENCLREVRLKGCAGSWHDEWHRISELKENKKLEPFRRS